MSGTRLAAWLVVLPAGLAGQAAEPVRIGTRLEPLFDEFLIESTEGARLTLNHPIPREVAIVHDAPWEGSTCCYHTVFRDGEKYRMYYRGSHYDLGTRKATHPEVVCYAESEDGIHWVKPNLGLFEFNGSRENNIVWQGIAAHNFAPFKDTHPRVKPDEQYKAIGSGKGGLYPFKSPDGIHWSLMSEKPVITDGAFDSQNLAFYDSVRGRYVDFHRDFRSGVRDIKTCVSEDFLHWSKPVWLEYTGAPPEHLYTNQISPYFRAPHVLLGFPKRFVPNRKGADHPLGGISDGVFMTSRDGRVFHRWPEALIRPGPQPARWVNRNNMTAWGILETQSDQPGAPNELSIYSTEGYYAGEDCRLRRFTVRIDGFVSMQAPGTGGEFITRPLLFDPPAAQGKTARKATEPPVAIRQGEAPIGTACLSAREPACFEIPGTQDLGTKVTLAAHVRGVPAGRRRLFSTYDGGGTVAQELYFDFNAAGGDSDYAAIRFAYDTLSVGANEGIGDWSDRADTGATHHLAATWDDGLIAIYFDGKPVAQGGQRGYGPLTFRRGNLRFGEDYPPTSLDNEPFLGQADDILILRRVLSPEEIAKVAKSGVSAAVQVSREDGVLYTAEQPERGVLIDSLTADGAQNAALPEPPGPPEQELIINFATSAAGTIRCEIQDETGKPIPGYTLDECDEIFGDDMARPVSWRNGQTCVRKLAKRPIRLRFVMKDADLYSIQFK